MARSWTGCSLDYEHRLVEFDRLLVVDQDLDDAAKQALREMIKWLVELKGWTPDDAYCFCSLACDLRVTQLVDGFKGIHAMVEKKLLEY